LLPKLEVRAQGSIGRWVDARFEQLLLLVFKKAPRTYRWNNHHLNEKDVEHLNAEWMVAHEGDPKARRLPSVPVLSGALLHLTNYSNWRLCLVLVPETTKEWHIGWRWPGGAGVSRVRVVGPVEVRVGPGPTEWFGIEADSNVQTPIQQIGQRYTGSSDESTNIPLF
jgi:hypothetical protein